MREILKVTTEETSKKDYPYSSTDLRHFALVLEAVEAISLKTGAKWELISKEEVLDCDE